MTQNLDLEKRSYSRYLLISIIGSIINYAIGVPYLYLILKYVSNVPTSFFNVITTGCIVFIPWDMVKITTSEWVGKIIQNIHTYY